MTSYVPPGHRVWATADYGAPGPHLRLDAPNLGRFMEALFTLGGTVQSVSPPLSVGYRAWMSAQVTLPAGRRRQMESLGGVALGPPCGGFSSAGSAEDEP